MPVNQSRDAIVIALDVGDSVSTQFDFEEKTFFKQARDCVSWIIQRKIISDSRDFLSLLLIGSSQSSIPVSTCGYENIHVKFDFQLASWDMLKFIETEVETTHLPSDWFGALIVSLEMLKSHEEFNNVNCKKIVIFSDFTEPVSDNLERIINTIRELNIEITIIGPDHLRLTDEEERDVGCEDDEPEVKKMKFEGNLKRLEGERVVYEMWKKIPENVCICNFESALKQLCSYAPKPKRTSNWNCIMDIGDVNINVSVLKKTDPKPARKFNTRCSKQPDEDDQSASAQDERSEITAPTIRDTVLYYKHEVGESGQAVDVEVKPEDTIEGFRYGTTIIPFSEEDKAAMEYNSGPKSFSVLGFTHSNNVPYYLLTGECAYLVVPRDKDKNAEVALSAVIQAMKKLDCVGIARRVYSDNRGLTLGALFPTVEEISCDDSEEVSFKEYLLFVELAFEDDLKYIHFPSLETVAEDITDEQYDAVDGLIDGMDLMKADKGLRGEPCESFDLPFLHDFKEQFFHYCVIQKGLYPNRALPTSLPAHILNFIKVPKKIEENCEPIFNEINKLFKIKKIPGYRSRENTWRKKVHFKESFIEEDNNPFNKAWMKLFATGFPTNDELDKVYGTFEDLSESEKSSFLEGFRVVITRVHAMYLKWNPFQYNRWMFGFKKYLEEKRGPGPEIWDIIITEYVGVITKEANPLSKVTTEEAENFLCSDVKKPQSAEGKPDFEFLDELQAEQMTVEFD